MILFLGGPYNEHGSISHEVPDFSELPNRLGSTAIPIKNGVQTTVGMEFPQLEHSHFPEKSLNLRIESQCSECQQHLHVVNIGALE